MTKYWHIFYVSSYKGGELHSKVNITDINKVLDYVVDDSTIFDEFDSIENINELTEEDLYDIYCDNINNNKYAYDSRSYVEVYSTAKNGKLVEDFPTKEDIIKYMLEMLEDYKEFGPQ